MDLLEYNNDYNYVEIFFTNGGCSKNGLDIYKTNLESDPFFTLLNRMKNTKFKFFQKEYKEYVHKDIVCQSYTNDETKVFKKKTVKLTKLPKAVIVYYNKTKQTLLNFPSTTDLQQTTYIKKLIFRINNRIYVNFKISLDVNTDAKWYEVYINYNHETNVDTQLTYNTLNEVFKMLE